MPADQHQVVEIDGAELSAVDLMNAGVEGRSRPSDELLEIGVDDGAEAAVIAGRLLDAADRVGEGVAVIAEGEAHAVLFEPGTQAAGIGDLAQVRREGKCGRRVFATQVLVSRALAAAGAGGARNEKQRDQRRGEPERHARVHKITRPRPADPSAPIPKTHQQQCGKSRPSRPRRGQYAGGMQGNCDNTFRAGRRGVGLRRERVRPGMAGSMTSAAPMRGDGLRILRELRCAQPTPGRTHKSRMVTAI